MADHRLEASVAAGVSGPAITLSGEADLASVAELTALICGRGIDRGATPSEVANRLGVSAKARSVLRRENVFYADDDPVHRATTYIPWSIAKGTGLLQGEVPHQ